MKKTIQFLTGSISSCMAKYSTPSTLKLSMILSILLYTGLAQGQACTTGCTTTVNSNSGGPYTVNSGQTLCITAVGSFSRSVTVNSGGTLCISSSTNFNGGTLNINGGTINAFGNVSIGISLPNGAVFNNYKAFTGTLSMNAGSTYINQSSGTFTPSTLNVTGGALTNASGATATIPGGVTFNSGFVLVNSGAITTGSFTISGGARVSLTGTSQVVNGNVTNNQFFAMSGPSTINGSLNQSGGDTSTFTGGITITGNVSNNGVINLAGALNIGGNYSDASGATIKASSNASCNSVNITGTNSGGSGSATFNGNGLGLTVTPAPASSASLTNGAVGTPSLSPTAFTSSLLNTTVTVGYNSPSASINGYIILRSIGVSAPIDNPSNGTAYTAGTIIGACTVVAVTPSSSTGAKTYGDVIPANQCGKNVYYRIFSYNISSTCPVYNSTPLTGSQAIPAASTTVTPAAVTICSGNYTSLTAGAGGSSYIWNTGATTASISVNTTATYTVTVTNAQGCSPTASGAVTVNTTPTPSVNNANLCAGSTVTLTATGGTTYLWSTGATTAAITPSTAGTYTVTATTSGCSATASGTVSAAPMPSVVAGSNSPVLAPNALNLTSTVSSGTSPFSYSWSGPSAYTSTSANPSIASTGAGNSGTYAITVTDANTCTASASTAVTVIVPSPGGISTNLAIWLKANTGVTTSGANVTSWNDQSTLGNNANTVAGTNPTLASNALNSNPVVNFGGAGGLTGTIATSITASNASAFVVTKANSSTGDPSGIFSIVNTSGGSTDNATSTGAVFFQRAGSTITTTRSNANQGNYSGASAIGTTHLFTTQFNATQNLFFTEGAASNNTAFTATALNGNRFSIGARTTNSATSNYLNGSIAEIVLYNRLVSTAEKNKIESYLATKYGITLDQTTATDYTSSTGSTVWSSTANGAYKNNIFGIAQDNVNGLNQSSSASINANTYLSISGASAMVNNAYLYVSDNGLSQTDAVTTAGLPGGAFSKISAVFRLSETIDVGTVNFTFTNNNYYSVVTGFSTPIMLIDANADGVYETYQNATSSAGNVFTFNRNIANGTLFSFGFLAAVPLLDYSDASGSQTTRAQNGAAHKIVNGVMLGARIDAETDGIPSANMDGDDLNAATNDEDGVDFNIGVATNGQNIIQIGQNNTINVTAGNVAGGYLSAWIDFNQNGSFSDAGEQVISNQAIAYGQHPVTFFINDSVLYGPTAMRFRYALTNTEVTGPNGLAPSGEVEDYKVYLTAPLVSGCSNGFQNDDFENGPHPGTYIITNQNNNPYWRTTAPDGMEEVWASGFNGVPAYHGNYFMELNANMAGALYQDIYTTPGTVVVWHFAHRARVGTDVCTLKMGPPGSTSIQYTASDGTGAWGFYQGTYVIPANQYITRFEFNAVSTGSGSISVGNFLDYVYVSTSFDYGDAPNSYGTLKSANGPYHGISTNLFIGPTVTCDQDGTPDPSANFDGGDDGVTFLPISGGATYNVNVKVNNQTGSNATLAGWIDFNKNGVFDAAERASVTVASNASMQTVVLTFNLSTYSLSGKPMFARFRLASDPTEVANPTGVAVTGEVEDYLFKCPSPTRASPAPTWNSPLCKGDTLMLTATSSITPTYYYWSGPNSYSASTQNASKLNTQYADTGKYTVFTIFSDGCAQDSALTRVTITPCYVNLSGSMWNDGNGNGVINPWETSGTLGQTLYGVLTDATNIVLATAPVTPATGAFNFTGNVPAFASSMKISASVTNPTVGSTFVGPTWPAGWVSTKENYGAQNSAGTGVYVNAAHQLPVSTTELNVSSVGLGYDRVPATLPFKYTIAYPRLNTKKRITAANFLGPLQGTDPEQGTINTGGSFTFTDLSLMNGNQLYYDINADDSIAPSELITAGTTIANYNPALLFIKFSGYGSINAKFYYATVDSAGKADPATALFVIDWTGGLPVKLMYFTAEKQGEHSSLLKWSTASETDNDHFDVERSTNGDTWEKIGTVNGAGTTSQTQNYSLIDQHPSDGVNYYRLKQVDYDGKYEYSPIATVVLGSQQTDVAAVYEVYPNPAPSGTAINLSLTGGESGINHITVTDIIGEVVYQSQVEATQNYRLYDLNLKSGIYFVSVSTTTNESYTQKIVVR